MSNSTRRHFEALIEPHLDTLFRTAFRMTRNKADAEDLVQETCVRAWLRISDLDESRQVQAWLLRVLHNIFVDGTRRAQRSPVTDLGNSADAVNSSPCMEPGAEESACASQLGEQLQRAWSRLDSDQRALLALRAEGHTSSELAEIAGLRTDVLHARLYRARQSLARYLADEEATESENRREMAK